MDHLTHCGILVKFKQGGETSTLRNVGRDIVNVEDVATTL